MGMLTKTDTAAYVQQNLDSVKKTLHALKVIQNNTNPSISVGKPSGSVLMPAQVITDTKDIFSVRQIIFSPPGGEPIETLIDGTSAVYNLSLPNFNNTPWVHISTDTSISLIKASDITAIYDMFYTVDSNLRKSSVDIGLKLNDRTLKDFVTTIVNSNESLKLSASPDNWGRTYPLESYFPENKKPLDKFTPPIGVTNMDAINGTREQIQQIQQDANQEGYAGLSELNITYDPVTKRYKVNIPDAIPERPILGPYELASDLAAMVLEEGKFFRVGDVRLPLTVENISVSENNSSSMDFVPILRSKGTLKRNAGHMLTTVEVSVLYEGIDDLNGWTLDHHGVILEDPLTGERPILSGLLMEHGGLRPLISIFRRCPFVPVVNSALNNTHNIDAVAFQGLQIETVPEAPACIRVILSFIKFDYSSYIPDATSFTHLFNWPLFSKYVYNGLCATAESATADKDGKLVLNYATGPKAAPKLKPIPILKTDGTTMERNYSMQGGVVFHIADEDELKAIRDGQSRAQINMDRQQKDISDKETKLTESKKRVAELEVAEEPTINDSITDSSGGISLEQPFRAPLGTPTKTSTWDNDTAKAKKDMEQAQADLNQAKKDAITLQVKLAQQRNEPESTLSFVPVNLPQDAILEQVSVAMRNSFSAVQLESREQPTLQYLGGQDTQISLVFSCQEPTVKALTNLHAHVQRLSREYRWISAVLENMDTQTEDHKSYIRNNMAKYVGQQLETGFLKINQEMANLCGVESVLIEDVDYQQISEAPGWYKLVVRCVDFDRTQKKHEVLNKMQSRGFAQTSSLGTVNAMQKEDYSLDQLKDYVNSLPSEEAFKKMLFGIDLYPDLELPTFATVNAWITELLLAHKPVRIDPTPPQTKGIEPPVLFAGLYTPPYGDNELLDCIRVDPDFYISTTATMQDIIVDHIMQMNMEPAKEDGTGGEPLVLTDEHQQGAIYHCIKKAERTGSGGEDMTILPHVSKDGRCSIVDSLVQTQLPGGVQTTKDNVAITRMGGQTDSKYDNANSAATDPTTPIEDQNNSQPASKVGGPEFQEASLFANMADNYQYGKQGRLLRAFPTFWCVLVDGGRILNNMLFNDNFYGVNGVQSLTVVKNREHAAHLCLLRMSNVYGNYTNQSAQRALDEGIRRKGLSEYAYWFKSIFYPVVDEADVLRREQEITGLFLQPGVRLHVRMGYGNCPAALPVVFNGVVAETSAGEGAVNVIAQGDGIELMTDIQAEPNNKLGGFFHGSEPQDLLGSLLAARGGVPPAVGGGAVRRFTEWIQRLTYHMVPTLKPESPFGIHHFGNPFYKIGGEKYGEVMQNIYRSNDKGARPGYAYRYGQSETKGKIDGNYDEKFAALTHPANIAAGLSEWTGFMETLSAGQKEFSTELYGKSVWDLCTMSMQVAPDYICQVVPWGFRSSLFYGKPYYSYCYDYDMQSLQVPVNGTDIKKRVSYGSLPEHWIDSDKTLGDDAGRMTAWALSAGMGAAIFTGPIGVGIAAGVAGLIGASQLFTDNVKYCNPFEDKKLQGIYSQLGSSYTSSDIATILQKAQIRKPFQQVYGLNSVDDIISDNITASSEGVFTVVRGTYKCKHWSFLGFGGGNGKEGDGVSLDMTLPIYADVNLFPENKRTAVVPTEIYVGKLDQLASVMTNKDPHGNLANNVATTILKNFMSYMYKGNLTILGIPSIKPCDLIIIDDFYNELHGPVGVREVVHSLSIDTGMVTEIEPDCLVSITDQRLLRNWSIYRSMCGTMSWLRLNMYDEAEQIRGSIYENLTEQLTDLEALFNLAQQQDLPEIYTAPKKKIQNLLKEYKSVLSECTKGRQIQPGEISYLGNVFEKVNTSVSHIVRQNTIFDWSRQGTRNVIEAPLLNEQKHYTLFDTTYLTKLEVERVHSQVIQTLDGDSVPPPVSDLFTLLDGTSSTTVKKLTLDKTKYPTLYVVPENTGGPSGWNILRLATILSGENELNPGLMFRLIHFLEAVDIDAMIMQDAIEKFAVLDPKHYAKAVKDQEVSYKAELEAAKVTMVAITSLFTSEQRNTKRTEILAAIRRRYPIQHIQGHTTVHPLYRVAIELSQPISLAGTQVESPVVLAGLFVDVETEKLKKPECDDILYEKYIQDLAKIYMLYLAGKKNKEKSLYTGYIADHILRSCPEAFLPAVHNSLTTSNYYQIFRSRSMFDQALLGSSITLAIVQSKMFSRLFLVQDKFVGSIWKWGKNVWASIEDVESVAYVAGKATAGIAKAREGVEIVKNSTVGTKVIGWLSTPAENALKFMKKTFSLRSIKSTYTVSVDLMKAGKFSFKELKAGISAAQGAAALSKTGVAVAEVSNPVGWIVGILAITGTIILGNLVNMLNRFLRNFHAIQIVPLKKHGVEFSAGLGGHQGLIYGEEPNKMQRIFNHLSGESPTSQINAVSIAASFLGVRFPYLPEMDENVKKMTESVDNLFNSTAFGNTDTRALALRSKLGELGDFLASFYEKEPLFGTTPTTVKESTLSTETISHTAVLSPSTFQLPDGRKIKLTGIKTPHPSASQTETWYSSLAMNFVMKKLQRANWEITTQLEDINDTSGFKAALVTVGKDHTSLNELLLAEGLAETDTSNGTVYGNMLQAEVKARKQKKNLWSVVDRSDWY